MKNSIAKTYNKKSLIQRFTLDKVAICTPCAGAFSSSESLGFSSVKDLTRVAIDFFKTYTWKNKTGGYENICNRR